MYFPCVFGIWTRKQNLSEISFYLLGPIFNAQKDHLSKDFSKKILSRFFCPIVNQAILCPKNQSSVGKKCSANDFKLFIFQFALVTNEKSTCSCLAYNIFDLPPVQGMGEKSSPITRSYPGQTFRHNRMAQAQSCRFPSLGLQVRVSRNFQLAGSYLALQWLIHCQCSPYPFSDLEELLV